MTVDGVGTLLVAWAEYWKLSYDECGHEQWFSRTGHRLFEPAEVEHEVRTYYARCEFCAYAARRRSSGQSPAG